MLVSPGLFNFYLYIYKTLFNSENIDISSGTSKYALQYNNAITTKIIYKCKKRERDIL